jgi:hypothetical protein
MHRDLPGKWPPVRTSRRTISSRRGRPEPSTLPLDALPQARESVDALPGRRERLANRLAPGFSATIREAVNVLVVDRRVPGKETVHRQVPQSDQLRRPVEERVQPGASHLLALADGVAR